MTQGFRSFCPLNLKTSDLERSLYQRLDGATPHHGSQLTIQENMKTLKLLWLALIIACTLRETYVTAFQRIGLNQRVRIAKILEDSHHDALHSRHARTRLQTASSDTETISPWSPGRWMITLQFKREDESSDGSIFNDSSSENTASINKLLGEEWGTNSAQLALPFEVLVTSDVPSQKLPGGKQSIQSAWLGGKPTGTIECIPQTADELYHATYINDKGQQQVQISSGQWRIEPPMPLMNSPTGKSLPGQASTLRFSLTIQSAIQRNSIKLPENQLLLLQCNTFREDQYEDGVRTLLPFLVAKDNSQKMLDEQLDHESGDRRLDGNEVLPLLEAYKDVAGLVWERDERYRRWKDVESVLPLVEQLKNGYDVEKILDDDSRWGVWPGDTDLLTVERGIILAVTDKRNAKGGAFSWMESRDAGDPDTAVVGTWSAMPIWDDD